MSRYLGGLARGDLGRSFATKRSVRARTWASSCPPRWNWCSAALRWRWLIGIPAGILAGANERSAFDRVTGVAAVLGAAAPVFALALLAQQVFFNQLHWLPLSGRLDAEVSLAHPVTFVTGFLLVDTAVTGNWAAWRDALEHLILPALVVAVYPLAIVLRMTRNSMVDVAASAAHHRGACQGSV